MKRWQRARATFFCVSQRDYESSFAWNIHKTANRKIDLRGFTSHISGCPDCFWLRATLRYTVGWIALIAQAIPDGR
jgi:hypothetical protein